MKEKKLRLKAYWQHEPMTIREFSNKAKEYLKILTILHPKFTNLLIWKTGLDKIVIKDDYSNFEELFYKGAYDNQLVYTNLDQKGFITNESTGPFRITFSNKRKHTDDVFSITLNENYNPLFGNFSSIQFNFPENDPSFFEWEFCKNILEHTASFWKAEFANIYTFDFMDKVESMNTTFGSLGWINYFPNNKVLDLVTIKDVDSIITSLGSAHCIITLTNEIPDVNNQEDINKAIYLRDIIAPKGFLNWAKQ
ncbi:hypothetical protein ABIB40_003198 [Pedobacter sp. UYP30]|uniref:hypothetical protein n=1 Tax=Pedobacter sp. UYP30 TaxID=1756400 RepID=UPI003392138E